MITLSYLYIKECVTDLMLFVGLNFYIVSVMSDDSLGDQRQHNHKLTGIVSNEGACCWYVLSDIIMQINALDSSYGH